MVFIVSGIETTNPFLRLLFTNQYLHNTLAQYFLFLGSITLAVMFSKLLYYFSKKVFIAFTRKTKTRMDDIFIQSSEKPIVILIVIVGYYVGYQFLTLSPATKEIFFDLFRVFFTIDIGWFLIMFLDKLIVNYVHPWSEKTETQMDDQLIPLLQRLMKIIILTIVMIIVLDTFGFQVTSLIAGLGIGGLAVALAAQDILKNFFGGLTIIADKTYRLNDRIRVNNLEGKIVDIGMRSTRIKTPNGELITIPNQMIVDNPVINYHNFSSRRVKIILGLTYDTSIKKIKKAKEILFKLLKDNPKVKDDFQVHFTELGDFSLKIEIRVWTKVNTNKGLREFLDQFNLSILEKFEREGIVLAFPTQTIELKGDMHDTQ